MKATRWEFSNRALVFGLIFGCAFPLYAIDPENVSAAAGNWLGARMGWNLDLVARALFAGAAVLMVFAALLRTWASAYLHASVVYAADLKSEALVADGPYRRVRNRLIFREESELQASQGESYRAYCRAVPRLWPSLVARISSAGSEARWKDGFKAESWYWGFALALAAFAITLQLKLFFVIFALSLTLFWVMSTKSQKKSSP
jgi:hypothetical protein